MIESRRDDQRFWLFGDLGQCSEEGLGLRLRHGEGIDDENITAFDPFAEIRVHQDALGARLLSIGALASFVCPHTRFDSNVRRERNA